MKMCNQVTKENHEKKSNLRIQNKKQKDKRSNPSTHIEETKIIRAHIRATVTNAPTNTASVTLL